MYNSLIEFIKKIAQKITKVIKYCAIYTTKTHTRKFLKICISIIF